MGVRENKPTSSRVAASRWPQERFARIILLIVTTSEWAPSITKGLLFRVSSPWNGRSEDSDEWPLSRTRNTGVKDERRIGRGRWAAPRREGVTTGKEQQKHRQLRAAVSCRLTSNECGCALSLRARAPAPIRISAPTRRRRTDLFNSPDNCKLCSRKDC